MASRRVLVFDNDIAFITLLKSSLGAYGVEVQGADPRSSDIINRVKALKPNAIFIAVDSPDKFGYTLKTKVRKAVGNKIPIILATTTISPRDFALHGKTKMRADVYLDKKSLSRKKLLQKLDELIGLESKTVPLPPEDHEDASGRLGGSSAKVNEDAYTINLEELSDDELASAFEFLDETIESKGNANLAVQVKTDVMDEQTVKGDLEIIHLKKKLHDSYRKILSDNKRLKEFEKEVAGLKREIGRGQKREKDLTALVQNKENEINRAQESLNALEQKFIEEQQAHQHFEAKIAKLQAAVSKADKKSLDQLRVTEEKHKHDIQALKMKYSSEISQQQNEMKAEIEALKHKLTEEAQSVSDLLIQERQKHKEIRQHFEAKTSELQNQHASAIKQAELEKHSALESVKKQIQEALGKTEESPQHTFDAIEKNYTALIAQLQNEKNAEIEALRQKQTGEPQKVADILVKEEQSHQQTRQQLEAEIEELQAAVKDAKKQPTAQPRDEEKSHETDLFKDEKEKPETDLPKDEEELEADLEADLEAPEEKKPTKQISPPQKEKKAEIEEEEPPDEWLEL